LKAFRSTAEPLVTVSPIDLVDQAKERILTLKAYIDEAERELFNKDWDNLLIYLNIITEQDEEFALLIDNLFPSDDLLDASTREAMTYEAQSLYLALDDLKKAAKDGYFQPAQNAYAKLLLSYDRFLKAGNLYPTYDPITSTEIFFADTPRSTLPFDTKSKIKDMDHVILTSGPDMGKTGVAIYLDRERQKAVVKFDKDGKVYQEVKVVKFDMLAKASVPDTHSRHRDVHRGNNDFKKKK
jgi:hypothetical protein